MSIYNFNLLVGYMPNGVDFAQAYRSKLFDKLASDSFFVFTDIPSRETIDYYCQLGIKEEKILYLYQSFTDQPTMRLDYSVEEFEKSLMDFNQYDVESNGRTLFYKKNNELCYKVLLSPSMAIDLVEVYHQGRKVRLDRYGSAKLYSECSIGATTIRYFYQKNGAIAYEQIVDAGGEYYRFSKNEFLYSKEQFLEKFIKSLNLSATDTVIMDRNGTFAQPILSYKNGARLGYVIHSEHVGTKQKDHIYWNTYYDYVFQHQSAFDFFVVSTSAQQRKLEQNFQRYQLPVPHVVSLPVGALERLRYPDSPRKPFGLVTVSRLSFDKKIDWLILAIVRTKPYLPELTLDIYGDGDQYQSLQDLIRKHQATSYIRLMGHQDVSEIYQQYETYVTTSTGETFGLSLLEALGAGLAFVGLDVPYGNHTFIQPDYNGKLVPYSEECFSLQETVSQFSDKVIELYQENLESYHTNSYHLAQNYLEDVVCKQWQKYVETRKKDEEV